jgi:hypothetical protein
MLRIDSSLFFVITLALFTVAALIGLWLRHWRRVRKEPEELSITTLLGAALGLFGIMLGFTFYIANSRFEERRQLEVAEANDLHTLWFRTSFLSEPAANTERFLLRQYVPARIQFFSAGPGGPGYEEALRQSAELQSRMWQVANDEAAGHRDSAAMLFLTTLSESIQAADKRTAAFENRIPILSWAIMLLLGMMACVLLAVDLKSHSYILRGMLQVALAASLALTYDIDNPRKGFVQVSQQSMMRVQNMINATPAD